jgi:biopolymer transport protein ExbD
MARLAGRFDGKPMATPNMAPMIGVLMAVFAGGVGLAGAAGTTTSVELPLVASIYCGPARHATVLAVGAGGALSFEGRAIETEALDAALAKLAAADHRLAIWARPDTGYGVIQPLITAAGRAGVGVDLISTNAYPEPPDRTSR